MRKSDLDSPISWRWRVVLLALALRENRMSLSQDSCDLACWLVGAFTPIRRRHVYPISTNSPVSNCCAASRLAKLFTDHHGGQSDQHRIPSNFGHEALHSASCYIFMTGNDPLLSELDAIKILRAYPPHAKKQVKENIVEQDREELSALRACSSAHDVLQVLHQACSTYKPSAYQADHYHVEPIVNAVSTNIASAALRRLVSPPFIPASFTSTKKGIQYLNKQKVQQNDISELEKGLYIQLTTLLQKKLHDSMRDQMESLQYLPIVDADIPPTLLPKNITLESPPTHSVTAKKFALNWYGLADLLFSTAVLSNFPACQSSQKRATNAYLQTIITTQFEKEYSFETFDTAMRYLSFSNEIMSSFVRCIGPRRVVRDVISPLVVVEAAKKRAALLAVNAIQDTEEEGGMLDSWLDEMNEYEDSSRNEKRVVPASFSSKSNYNRILHVISSYLSLPHSLDSLNCADLSTTLWSFGQIYSESKSVLFWSREQQHSLLMGGVQVNLIRSFMKRLRKVSVHSLGSGKAMAQAVWSVDRLVGLIGQQLAKDRPTQDNEILVHGQSFLSWNYGAINDIDVPSSIRFPGEFVPISASLKKDEVETKGIAENLGDTIPISFDILREEAIILFYTLSKELLKNKRGTESYYKMKSLSFEQIADILQAAISLQIPLSDLSALIPATIGILTSHASTSSFGVIGRCSSCKQIARMLWSLQRLRVGSCQFDFSYPSDCVTVLPPEEKCVAFLGDRFLDIVRDQTNKERHCDPKTLATILRSAVMMFSGESIATNAMLDAASYLILDACDENNIHSSSPFLLRCNEYEVSNFLFAFAIARRFDEDIFLQLTAQMLENDVVESCTASSASRAMWSCAVLLSLKGAANFLHERQVDLFHQMGGILLMSQLTPTDISNAMWAMARCEYVLDRGLFDFLAEKLSGMLESSNTRLVAQALWACAKIFRFEEPRGSIDNQPPPYMTSAEKFVSFLIANGHQMTPRHISQTIWATGCLRLSDPVAVEEMAFIALRNAALFNSQEIANIVWGFSKVNYNNPKIISELVQQITESVALKNQCGSQEAANILYALGKLQICDSKAFETLSYILMSQLQSASSQGIANALWAYDVVGLDPPRELLGCWAREKLGLEGVASKRMDICVNDDES